MLQRGLRGLLVPIGRNLIEVNIVGLGPGPGKVFVQVTHHDHHAKVKDKWERMQQEFQKQGECFIAAGGSCPIGIPEKAFISID